MVIVDLMNLKKNYQAKSNSEMNMIKAVGVAVTKFMCDKLDEFLENYHTSAMILDPGHKNQLRFLVDEERFQKVLLDEGALNFTFNLNPVWIWTKNYLDLNLDLDLSLYQGLNQIKPITRPMIYEDKDIV